MLASPALLHTAARRYLMTCHELWTSRYGQISGSPSAGYTAEQLDTFPRYNVLAAILAEVERLDPAGWDTVDSAREYLAMAAFTADDMFTKPPHGPVEMKAMQEERDAFAAYIRGVNDEQLMAIEPLPFRRVLDVAEEDRLRSRLLAEWGISKEYWYPLTDSSRTDVLALQAPYFRRALCPQALQDILVSHGVARVYELREYGPSYELELGELDPVYTGAEGLWFTQDLSWVVYATHESSITIGGQWLIAEIQRAWPEWESRLWTSPFF